MEDNVSELERFTGLERVIGFDDLKEVFNIELCKLFRYQFIHFYRRVQAFEELGDKQIYENEMYVLRLIPTRTKRMHENDLYYTAAAFDVYSLASEGVGAISTVARTYQIESDKYLSGKIIFTVIENVLTIKYKKD